MVAQQFLYFVAGFDRERSFWPFIECLYGAEFSWLCRDRSVPRDDMGAEIVWVLVRAALPGSPEGHKKEK